VVGHFDMPEYKLGPLSKVYPFRFQECAAPPATECDSTTVTFLPYNAHNAPAHKPPIPPPITTTSVVWVSTLAKTLATRRLGEALLQYDFEDRAASTASGRRELRPENPGARIATGMSSRGETRGTETKAGVPRRREWGGEAETLE
tara:strand:+ start:488 stop:925 length:438 start_codon:yes stop_codon:yes gene_type:complete